MKLEPGLAALHAVRMANSPRISSSVAACAAILRQLWLENIARLHQLAQLAESAMIPANACVCSSVGARSDTNVPEPARAAQKPAICRLLTASRDGAAADVKSCQLDLRQDLRAGRPGLRADMVEHALGHVLVELGPLDRLAHSPIMSNTGGCALPACSFSSSTPASATSSTYRCR